ncbi:MAG: diaminopimelate decarboxylase family protein [Candidatus Jordarchaeum sp.]|uniref:diaminopimelate decarboxylase family protein n=1 Tax=Candidatus Jordarchaeum sp. TaxID=2823881 RepID=UPI0040498144
MSSLEPKDYLQKKDFAEPLNLKDLELFFEDSSVQKLAEKLGTRVYILSLNQLERNAKRFRAAIEGYPQFKPSYALAANALPQVAQTLVNLGFGIEVVSIYELKHALSKLKNVPFIICNGVSKHATQNQQKESLIQTVMKLQKEKNITLNFNSIEEIKHAKEFCEKKNIPLKAGLSLNLASHFQNSELQPGLARFGIHTEQIPAAIKLLKNSKIKIEAVQSHIGTQVTKLSKLVKNAKILCDYAIQIGKKLETIIETINIGGGIAVNYYKTQKNKNLNPDYTIEEYAQNIIREITQIYQKNGADPPTIITETGRWLTANTMILLLKATETRKTPQDKHQWIITDCSALTDTNDTVCFGQYFEIVNATKIHHKPTNWYNIAGITCDSNDVFAWPKNNTGPRKLPKTDPGDILTVLDVGAYQLPLRNNFNLLPKTPIYTHKGQPIK